MIIRLQRTKPFKADYKGLPAEIKERAKKQLRLLTQNPHHPSLRIKKMEDPRAIWEERITRSYRFTFQIKGSLYLLRRIGRHDVLRRP